MIILRCYLDPSDPVAAQVFAQLPEYLVGCAHAVDYLPVRGSSPGSTSPADGDALLTLCWSCAPPGSTPSRWALEQVLALADSPAAVATDEAQRRLAERLAAQRRQDDEQAGQAWRAASEAAAARGISRLPAIELGAQRFVGLDSLPRLRAAVSTHGR